MDVYPGLSNVYAPNKDTLLLTYQSSSDPNSYSRHVALLTCLKCYIKVIFLKKDHFTYDIQKSVISWNQ